jgi:hypothetical protein
MAWHMAGTGTIEYRAGAAFAQADMAVIVRLPKLTRKTMMLL